MSEESGSTILGIVGALVAVFFIYSGSTGMWWWYDLQVPNILTYSLGYLIVGIVGIGVAIYGLKSKRIGANFLVAAPILLAGIFGVSAVYFRIFSNDPNNIYYSVNFILGWFILSAFALGAKWGFERRGYQIAFS